MADESIFPEDIDDELEDDELLEDEEEVIGYKIAPYFDTQSGDFILNGSGQITTADEVTAYTQWCEAVIATDRYNHDAYSDDIGIDYDEIFAAADHEEAEMIIESEISEALACDPYGRTQYVQNVQCEWTGPDEVMVTVEIVALDNELVTLNTTISK
jgi:hypothetical protein